MSGDASGRAAETRGRSGREVAAPTQRSAPRGPRAELVSRIHERLTDAYGTPEPGERLDPLDEVIFTILSQNTTDTNRDRAWESLWEEFDGWEEVAAAEPERIAEAIRVGGLHQTKSKRIVEILEQVHEEHGEYSLAGLYERELDEAREALDRYKGLGAKSINCVLLFSLGLPAFPVDTHVHRVMRRVGVLDTKGLSTANRRMQELVADEIAYPLHMNVIRHGREVCRSRRPRCGQCVLDEICDYDEKVYDDV